MSGRDVREGAAICLNRHRPSARLFKAGPLDGLASRVRLGALLVGGLVLVGPVAGQEFEPPRPAVDRRALLARAMACLTGHFPRVRDQSYVPVFRVYADATGMLTRAPVLTNPSDGSDDAVRFVREASRALVQCQPLPMDVRPGSEGREEFSRLIRFDPSLFATGSAAGTMSAGRANTPDQGRSPGGAGGGATGKIDLRGLTLGMSKADALAVVTSKLGAKCPDPDDGATLYTCHASAPAATFSLAFTVVPPSVLARVTYRFMTTHDRSVVIGDVTRSFGPPLAEANRLDWATWALGRSTRLHLQRGGDDWYDLILDDDEIASRAYEAVQRARNAAPAPRF